LHNGWAARLWEQRRKLAAESWDSSGLEERGLFRVISFKTRLDRALSNLIYLVVSLLAAGGLD